MFVMALSAYSIVQAYRKRRYLRGLFFWAPLLVLLTVMTGSGFMKYRYVRKLNLRGNGTHIDLVCKPVWDTKFNVPIADI